MADLTIRNVSKRFVSNGVLAVDSVTADFSAGSVHAIVGENGAGKSTLMHLVAGYHGYDDGTIGLGDGTLLCGSTAASLSAGVHMVYQYPHVVDDFPVWQQLLLASRSALIRPRVARQDAANLVSAYNLSIDIETPMSQLNPSHLYLLGIAVAASQNPRVLILDEPTVGCTDSEIESIFRRMEAIAALPAVVILITHRLADVFRLAETVLVMRRGRAIAFLETGDTSTEELSRLMLGESTSPSAADAGTAAAARIAGSGSAGPQTGSAPAGSVSRPVDTNERPVLDVESVGLNLRGRSLLSDVAFQVYSGEILGMIGMRENGLDSIEEVLSGMVSPTGGRISFNGQEITAATPRELRNLGIAYIPTNRLTRGASLGSSVAENLIVTQRRGMHRFGVLRRDSVDDYVSDRTEDLDIRGGPGEPLFRLSGGNIQKVILSRELSGNPPLLVFAEPSWGLDVTTRSRVTARLRALRDQGTAAILITTDLDEIIELADRTIVVRDGTVVPVPTGADRETIGRIMLGVGAE